MSNQIRKSANAKKMQRQFLFCAILFISFLKTNASNYYWVGGTGTWSDFANHWATTSGGNIFYAQVPTSSDDAFFDNNSFTSNTDIVTGVSYNYCNNLYLNSPFTPVLPTLTVASSVFLQTLAVTTIGIHLSGLGTTNAIYTGGNILNLVIDSAGTWSLFDNFKGNISILANATLYTNGHDINITGTSFLHDYNGKIYFGTSNITMNSYGSTFFVSAPAEIYGDSATFFVNGIFSHYNGTNGHHFKSITANNISLWRDTVQSVIFMDSLLNFSGCRIGNLQVNAFRGIFLYDACIIQSGNIDPLDNSIGRLTINGNNCFFKTDSTSGNFNATCHIDTLLYATAGGNMYISPGDTLYINNKIVIVANNISTASSFTTCYIYCASGTVCLDINQLTYVHAIGGATFFAGASCFDNGGNAGWTFTACATGTGNCSVMPGWTVWTGLLSDDWNNAQNWCDGVPTAGTNAAIIDDIDTTPGIQAPLHQPVIKPIMAAVTNKFRIEGANKLKITSGNLGSLTVNDSLSIKNSNSEMIIDSTGPGTIQFGNGTLNNQVYVHWAGMRQRRMQMIYQFSDFYAKGFIDGDIIDTLVFNIAKRQSTVPYQNVVVYFYYTFPFFCFSGNTPAPDVQSMVPTGPTTRGVLYSGSVDMSSQIPVLNSAGQFKLPLTNPFIFHGATGYALVLQITYSNPSIVGMAYDLENETAYHGCNNVYLNYSVNFGSTPLPTDTAQTPNTSPGYSNITTYLRPDIEFHVTRQRGKFPISVKGNWENNGTFNAGKSEVTLDGTSLQNLDGDSSTTFYQLKINNSSNIRQITPATVLDTMRLSIGKFLLNGKTLTLRNGNPGALIRTSGGILSEDVPPNYGRVNWKIGNNLSAHVVPFVNNAGTYIPFTYNLTTGTSDLSIAIYATSSNNSPLPTSVASINNASGANNSADMVDRYWITNDSGAAPVADLTFSYAATENAANGNTNIRSQGWYSSSWHAPTPAQSNPNSTSNLSTGITQLNTTWALVRATSLLVTNDYYWVGGTGNWSDFANHWATSSGGTTFHTQPPTTLDNVYFDNNSFSAAGQTVTVNQPNNYCNNFNWQNAITGSDLITSDTTYQIRVFGSLAVNPGAVLSYYGTFSFESVNAGNTINVTDTVNCIFSFNSAIGEWSLSNELKSKSKIELLLGTFTTNNFNITCNRFVSDNLNFNRSLNIGTSAVKIKSYSYFDNGFYFESDCAWLIDAQLNINGSATEITFEIPDDADTTLASPNVVFGTNIQFTGGIHNYQNIISNAPGLYGSHAVVTQSNFGFKNSQVQNILLNNNTNLQLSADGATFSVDTIQLTGYTDPQVYIFGISDTLNIGYIAAGTTQIETGIVSDIEKIIANGNLSVSMASVSTPVSNNNYFGNVFTSGNFTETNALISLGIIPTHFRKCVIHGDGTFNSYCSFDTLMFSAGRNYLIKAGDSVTVNNNFIAFGNTSNLIQFTSNVTGTQATINFTQGNVCSDYLFLRDINATGANIFAGANSQNISNNTGWQFTPCSIVSDVWPGDANYDLTANNVDVLNIGLAYGDTGAVRSGASLNWIAQPANDWQNYFQSAVNHKHADCNGDGVVDNNDTAAIYLNYGLTHPARMMQQQTSSTTPPLYVVAVPDTVAEGDTVEVDFYLGTAAMPVDSIYGIAFTLNYDTALVDSTFLPFDFTGSWMGTVGTDLLPFEKELFSEGKMDIALTRTDHNNVSGHGYLGRTGVVIVDNVGARTTQTPPYVTLPLSISNITAVTASEYYLNIAANTEDVIIDTSGTTGVHYPDVANGESVAVYPNPAKDKIIIHSKQAISSIEIFNPLGMLIAKKDISASALSHSLSLSLENLNQGFYLLKINTGNGSVLKKVSVIKN